MSAKTIWIIVALAALIYVAGVPLGQLIIGVGHGLVTIGSTIQSIGAKFHG